jgi:hypothetical protein
MREDEVTPTEASDRIIKAFDAINHNFHVIHNNLPPRAQGMQYTITRLQVAANDQFHRYMKELTS